MKANVHICNLLAQPGGKERQTNSVGKQNRARVARVARVARLEADTVLEPSQANVLGLAAAVRHLASVDHPNSAASQHLGMARHR